MFSYQFEINRMQDVVELRREMRANTTKHSVATRIGMIYL